MPPSTRRRRVEELTRNVVDVENITPQDALNHAVTSSEALNPEQLQIVLSALDDEVDRRCKRLRTEANELAMAIRSAVNVEIMKLPKCVRSLSVSQFKDTYGKDVSAVVRSSINGAAGDVRQKFSQPAAGPAQTPSVARRTGQSTIPATPSTASRRPRRGELVMSMNGSPLGEASAVEEGLNVTVSLPQGELVSLASLAREANGASKNEKMTTLQNLQETISRMMADLDG